MIGYLLRFRKRSRNRQGQTATLTPQGAKVTNSPVAAGSGITQAINSPTTINVSLPGIDFNLAIQILQILGNRYSPDKVRELIDEAKEQPNQTEAGISAAIDRKFAPVEAERVKDDLATFALLASPPDFADYDFVKIILATGLSRG